MRIPAFMVVGTSSGAGKTTIARGIIASLKRRGLAVQSYKLGPDYIDAGHHATLTGRPCINLDAFLLPGQTTIPLHVNCAGSQDSQNAHAQSD